MPGRKPPLSCILALIAIQGHRIKTLLEDKAMHADFKEAWTEREEARTAVRGALAGGFAFRALQKTRRSLRKVIQAAEDRYLEVYACKLEEFTKAGYMKGWYGHLKGVGGSCRVRGWEASSSSGTRTESS